MSKILAKFYNNSNLAVLEANEIGYNNSMIEGFSGQLSYTNGNVILEFNNGYTLELPAGFPSTNVELLLQSYNGSLDIKLDSIVDKATFVPTIFETFTSYDNIKFIEVHINYQYEAIAGETISLLGYSLTIVRRSNVSGFEWKYEALSPTYLPSFTVKQLSSLTAEGMILLSVGQHKTDFIQVNEQQNSNSISTNISTGITICSQLVEPGYVVCYPTISSYHITDGDSFVNITLNNLDIKLSMFLPADFTNIQYRFNTLLGNRETGVLFIVTVKMKGAPTITLGSHYTDSMWESTDTYSILGINAGTDNPENLTIEISRNNQIQNQFTVSLNSSNIYDIQNNPIVIEPSDRWSNSLPSK